MTRAALLPAGSDPFLNAYWLRHYRTWADAVDELHIAVCGPLPAEVMDYTRACAAAVPNVTVHRFEKRTAHGDVLAYLIDQTAADHVLLIEDDAFIRDPRVVGDTFGLIERGDVDLVGCPRASYATENVISLARRRFGDEPRGLAFWPCFLFVARERLAATDRDFGATIWENGAKILGQTLVGPAMGDTFIWASYQLRDQGITVELRDGHRIGDPIPADADWFHVGSLSSGHGRSWQHELSQEKYAEEILHWRGLPPGEAAKRTAWWQRAWDHWDGGIPDYHAEYGAGLQQFMADFDVTQAQVDVQRASFDYLVTWAES